MTKSGLTLIICSHNFLTSFFSCSKAAVKSLSLVNSQFVWDSPFLYSKVESNKTILGFSIFLLIWGWITSLFKTTPSNTTHSDNSPPGIFSTFAYFLISQSKTLESLLYTIFTAFNARSLMRLSHLDANLVARHDLMISLISCSFSMLTGVAIESA